MNEIGGSSVVVDMNNNNITTTNISSSNGVGSSNNRMLMAQLASYENETEEKIYKDATSGKMYKCNSYTDRAILARSKIVLKQTLGRGTYSKVKQAYDLINMRSIAVKIIDCSKAPKDFQEKFLPRELEVWPRVNHPNIIRMHHYIINQQKIYMMLEYADGGDMLSYVQSINGPVGDRDCKSWMRQILSAVAYLHNMNIIHRDLKLENLLIETSTRMIKLCDFGFSKDLVSNKTASLNGKTNSSSSTSSLTTTTNTTTMSQSLIDELSRTYCGSKAYASPEILLGQPYDPKKADVWAVGVIFFIFLTGNMPFKEDKCNELILNQHKLLRLYWVRNTKIAPAVKALVKSIFTYEWTKRPTIDSIMSNEWFNEPVEGSSPNTTTSTTTPTTTTTTTSTTTTTVNTTSDSTSNSSTSTILDYNLRSRLRGSKRACCTAATSSCVAPTEDKQHRQIKAN